MIIVKSTLSLAEQLGLRTIAKGVESEEQLQFLKDNRCQQAQGFYFMPPLSSGEITERFKEKRFIG